MSIMNPVSNESAGLPLPAPEQLPDAAAINETAPGRVSAGEKAPGAGEKASVVQPAAPTAAMPPISLPLPSATSVNTTQTDVSTTTPLTPATIVDDGDLIEKEWVNKAKQIVEANRDDPYKQSEELTVFKADYMKKRYDKNIKLSK